MDSKKQDIAYFLSFCIEQYKHMKGVSGGKALGELDKYGVLEYLNEHYDALHTQNHHWILEEIEDFIELRKTEKE